MINLTVCNVNGCLGLVIADGTLDPFHAAPIASISFYQERAWLLFTMYGLSEDTASKWGASVLPAEATVLPPRPQTT